MGYLLYEISPSDPLVYVSAFAMITLTALAALLVPAWRVTRTDPARILRE